MSRASARRRTRIKRTLGGAKLAAGADMTDICELVKFEVVVL